jgi:spore germination protein YaaH
VYENGRVLGQGRALHRTVAVVPGVRNRFAVAAVDMDGTRSKLSRTLTIRTPRGSLPAPRDLLASDVGTDSFRLAWHASKSAVGYRVERDGSVLGQVRRTSMTVSHLLESHSYRMIVLAVAADGALSAPSALRVSTAADAPPSAPGSLTIAAVSDSTVTLAWNRVPGAISGYRVDRDGAVVGQVSGASMTLTGLAYATTYTLRVVAVDKENAVSPESVSIQATTAPPPQSTGGVYAFMLANDESFDDLQAHYQEIGTVAPTYFDCSTTDTLTGTDDGLMTGWALAHGVKVMPRVNCQTSTVVDTILNNPTVRTQWLTQLVATASANHYSGLTLDFESGPPADRAAFTSFVTQLAGELHAVGKYLTVCVSPKTADVPNARSSFYDYAALAGQADHVYVMAWDLHWSTSAPGSLDSMPWLEQVANYVSSLGNPARFIFGISLYGMDWPGDGGTANPGVAYEYSGIMSLAASVGASPTLDPTTDSEYFTYTDSSGVTHQVWFSNAQTEGDRITLAQSHGFGIGVWHLGEEDQTLWSNPLIAPGTNWP